MDRSLALIIFFSLLSLQFRASIGSGSVYFVDSTTHNYLRHPSSSETDSISIPEVGAAVSALLGFAPSSTLSAASSAKLNEVLAPNPFERPRAVFMLEVSGAGGSQFGMNFDSRLFGSTLRSKVLTIDTQTDIPLPDDDVSVISLNEDGECSDKEISDFASWLGGSYVTDGLEPFNGEFIIPMSDGSNLRLHLTKNADRKFTTSLVSLIRNIQKAIEKHQDISQSMYTPAELITGKFDAFKALEEIYGTEGVAQQGLELFVTSVSKIFNSLQTTFKGQIVGVFIHTGESLPDSKNMLNVVYTSRPTSRWLEEREASSMSIIIAEVALVRISIAWITGILLLIATLMGIYFLLNMPLTRDTLLYSNVKLD